MPRVADRVLALDAGKTTFHGPASAFAARSPARSRLFLRLNGQTAEAIPLIRATADEVAETSGWLVITCSADEKTRVLETLVSAGISILDFRLDETAGPPPATEATVDRVTGDQVAGGAS